MSARSKASIPNRLLVEVGWEVCQQVGGIYTVLRSKAPSMVAAYDTNYCLVGPYNADQAQVEFEEKKDDHPFSRAARALSEAGIPARFGIWLVPERPYVVLLDLEALRSRLSEIKYFVWENHGISTPPDDPLVDQVLLFGHAVFLFLKELTGQPGLSPVIAHFHEWMAGSCLPEIRRSKLPVSTVFTTHATLLGRYIATADTHFYEKLSSVRPLEEARRFNIEARYHIERAAAHAADVFTTLSELTAVECRQTLEREPDLLVPNGMHLERPVALHEFQTLHQKYKGYINNFVMAHFFPSYTFDLDNTLYFFTSGRYEYKNKGFDITLEALARLNWRLKQSRIERTIVVFLVTKRPFRSIHPDVLSNITMMEELRRTCEGIKGQIGDRLFENVAMGKKPWLFELVDEYWWIRLRRVMSARRSAHLPPIITHIPVDDVHDEVLNQLRASRLLNHADDPVKVVYHPDFITTTSPLFGMEYDQFVRGCHLGVFPSYYEPWGYTPLECLTLGVPALTSDLSGFGVYARTNVPDHADNGLWVIRRKEREYNKSADELADLMLQYVLLDRRERIGLRNRAESLAPEFDWKVLSANYIRAHDLAVRRSGKV